MLTRYEFGKKFEKINWNFRIDYFRTMEEWIFKGRITPEILFMMLNFYDFYDRSVFFFLAVSYDVAVSVEDVHEVMVVLFIANIICTV
jgi:hypothetical protein